MPLHVYKNLGFSCSSSEVLIDLRLRDRSGLPIGCTNEQATAIFGQYGTVKDVKVLPVSAGKTAAAAFVNMGTVDEAKWIVDNVSGNVPQNLNSPVTVTYATPKSERAAKGFGKGGKGMMNVVQMMMGALDGQWGGGSWNGGGSDGSWNTNSGNGWDSGGKGLDISWEQGLRCLDALNTLPSPASSRLCQWGLGCRFPTTV